MNHYDDNDNVFESSQNAAPVNAERPELPIRLELDSPVDYAGNIVDVLTFKNRVTVGMLKHLPTDPEKQKIGHFLPVISGMCGVHDAFVDQLGFSDFQKALEIAKSFF